MIKKCKKCGIPESYRTTRINKNGICNICEDFQIYAERLFDYEKNKPLFIERIERVKSLEGKYDCLLGISGGKDSSYVLKSLIEDYNLRVYTFTYDNTFLTEKSRNNIDKLVKKFGVDHEYFSLPKDLHGKIYRESLINTGYTCLGCALIAFIITNYLAIKKNIPLVFHGRSPAQMFKEFSRGSSDPFIPFIKINLNKFNPENNKNMALKAFRKAEKLIDRSLSKKTKEELLSILNMDPYSVTCNMFPEFLGFFLYHPYDEKFVKQETAYLEIKTHEDCAIHDAAEFISNSIGGCSVYQSELSASVRQGIISKGEMEQEIEKCDYLDNPPEKALDILCNRTSINREDLDVLIHKNRKRHKAYKRLIRLKSRLKARREIY